MASESVELILKLRAEGQAAFDSLKASVNAASGAANQAAGAAKTLDAAFDAVNQTLKININLTNESSQANKNHANSHTQSTAAAILYAEGIYKLIEAFKEATIGSALFYARTEQLGVVQDNLARANNLNVDAVRAQSKAVYDLGVSHQAARETINKMIFSQLDLTKATQLTQLAQNAAKIQNVSTSDALTGIIGGIVEQRVQMLKTYGIQIQVEAALQRGADKLHTSRQALSDYQRANIIFNEVLSRSPRIFGTFIASLDTNKGELLQWQVQLDDAKDALGERFAPALSRAIGLLTGATQNVTENADAWAFLGETVSAVSAGMLAARLTPGPPQAKAIVGLAVGAVVGAAGQIDPEALAIEQSTKQIGRIEEFKRKLLQDFNHGIISDKQVYLDQLDSLNKREAITAEDLRDKLAELYNRGVTPGSGKPDALNQIGRFAGYVTSKLTGIDPKAGIAIGTGLVGAIRGDKNPVGPKGIDIGQGQVVTREQIAQAQAKLANPGAPDAKGLNNEPSLKEQLDSSLPHFNEAVKAATKSAQAALDSAAVSVLSGAAKIEAERKNELEKLDKEFEVYDSHLRTDAEYNKNYVALVGKINKRYADLQAKQVRDDKVKDLQNSQAIKDVTFVQDIETQKADNENKRRLARAGRSGSDSDKITADKNESLDAAREEYQFAVKKAQVDLESAQAIFRLTGNIDDLKNKQKSYESANIIANGNLERATAKALTDEQIAQEQRKKAAIQQTLDLNKERDESSGKIDDATQNAARGSARDSAGRAVKLAQAQARPEEAMYSATIEYKDRIAGAKQEYEIAQQRIVADAKGAQEELDKQNAVADSDGQRNKNRIDFEKTIADLQVQQIKNRADFEKQADDARLDRTTQIIELEKANQEKLKGFLGELFDAASERGNGLGNFATNFAKGIVKTVSVNAGTLALKGVFDKTGDILGGQEVKDANGKGTGKLTPFGQILAGTPLGKDPAKLAQDKEIDSRTMNTKAILANTDALVGRTVGKSEAALANTTGPAALISGSPGAPDSMPTILDHVLSTITPDRLSSGFSSGVLQPNYFTGQDNQMPTMLDSALQESMGGTNIYGAVPGGTNPAAAAASSTSSQISGAIASVATTAALAGGVFGGLGKIFGIGNPASGPGTSATSFGGGSTIGIGAKGLSAVVSGVAGLAGVSTGTAAALGGLAGLAGAVSGTGAGTGAASGGGTAATVKQATGMLAAIKGIGGGGGSFGTAYDPNQSVGGQAWQNVKDNPFAAAGAVVAGATGIYAGVKQGGARGTLTAVSAGLGLAATFDPEPISKGILTIASMATGFAKALFGDPVAERQKLVAKTLLQDTYQQPQTLNSNSNLNGDYVDTNYKGQIRTSNLRAMAMVQQSSLTRSLVGGNLFNKPPQEWLPGQILSPYQQWGQAANIATAAKSSQAQPVIIQAFDAQSFMDRSHDIANAVKAQIGLGHPVANSIQVLTGAHK